MEITSESMRFGALTVAVAAFWTVAAQGQDVAIDADDIGGPRLQCERSRSRRLGDSRNG